MERRKCVLESRRRLRLASIAQDVKGKGVHMCGSDDVKESKFGVPIDIMETHSASKLELKFGSELTVDPCVGSFGVDDIEIFVR